MVERPAARSRRLSIAQASWLESPSVPSSRDLPRVDRKRGYTREAAIRPNKHHRTGNDRIACSYSPENICQSQIPIGRQGTGSESRSLQESRARKIECKLPVRIDIPVE